MTSLPMCARLAQLTCPPARQSRKLAWGRASVLLLTYLAYTAYHASRKPISIVKNARQFLNCDLGDGAAGGNRTCSSWVAQMDGRNEMEAKTTLGLLDTTYLVSYAIFMFISGIVAERMDLRYFLSFGMMLSGLFTFMLGLSKPLGIHSMWYLLLMQVLNGVFQTTGWPGVVTVVANWFGGGRKGLIFGVWNSHTSIGNILGSLIAAEFVQEDWGLSFMVPGAIIGLLGVVCFLVLVPHPSMLGLATSSNPASPVGSPRGEKASLVASQSTPEMKLVLNRQRISKIEDVIQKIEQGGRQEAPRNSLPRLGSFINLQEVQRKRDDFDLGNYNEHQNRKTSGTHPKEDKPIGFFGALAIPGVVEFSLCLFFSKLVSYTFLFWLPNYISSTSKVDARQSAILSTLFDIGGILGGVLAGAVSDHTGMNATTCAAMLVAAVPTLAAYQALVSDWCPISAISGIPVPDMCYNYNLATLVLTGILVNGPYALITTAVSAELGTHRSLQGSSRALATVTAIIDGTGSVGAAVGPFLAGWLSGDGQWGGVFSLLMWADLAALLLLTRLVAGEVRRWRANSKVGPNRGFV